VDHPRVHFDALRANGLLSANSFQALTTAHTHSHINTPTGYHLGFSNVRPVLVQGHIEIALGEITCCQTPNLFVHSNDPVKRIVVMTTNSNNALPSRHHRSRFVFPHG